MFLRVLFYCYKKTYVKLLLFLIREESNSQIHCFINCTKSSTIIPLRQAEQEKGDVLKKKKMTPIAQLRAACSSCFATRLVTQASLSLTWFSDW